MQTGTNTFDVRRYTLQFQSAGPSPFTINLYADARGRMVRLNIPAQGIDVVRDDLASSTARMLVYSNAGDEAVFIPASGFNLGATITRPPASVPPPANGRYPAVVLIGGAAINDRDGVLAGVPILGQLAGAVAGAGFIAVRYDKRGYGQSGGRPESTTLGDLADDARAVVRWLANRRDVDRDRIAVLGHAEGAWIAMLTANREGRVNAIVSIAAPATTGSELVLEQQRQALEALNAPPAERAEKIELQRRINAAVMSGTGWDGIAPELRAQADTPWFQSLLQFDPADVLEDVDEPILFVHGQLDMQVAAAHLDRIAGMARTESDSDAVAVVSVRGVNHLLAPAATGTVAEYATLQDRNVSSEVTAAVTGWLLKTLPAR
jgi:pimeloyl-ACP methyl ester carboxylesterase